MLLKLIQGRDRDAEGALPAVAVLGALTVKWVAAAGVTLMLCGAGDAGGRRVGGRDGLGAGGDEGDAVGEGVDAVVAGDERVVGWHAPSRCRCW